MHNTHTQQTIENHLLQIPKACSNRSRPKSPSPFCNAANANLVNSTASANSAFDNFVEFDDLPNIDENIPDDDGAAAGAGGGGNGLDATGGGIAGIVSG